MSHQGKIKKNCRDNLQCSEICGIYHGFMPIVVDAVSVPNYLAFLDSFNETNNITPLYFFSIYDSI